MQVPGQLLIPALLWALVPVLAACDGIGLARNAPELDAPAVAALMGLTLPPGATVEYKRVDNGMDQSARLVLLVPEAEWRAWRDRVVPPGGGLPRFSADGVVNLGSDDGGWAPSAARELTAVQRRWRGSEALNIGQAPAGGGRVRVWLYWFQT